MQSATPIHRCVRSVLSRSSQRNSHHAIRRSFNAVAAVRLEASLETSSTPGQLDPALMSTPSTLEKLSEEQEVLIGSRRRRAALNYSPNIPFEQLPYQCFQEARKILQADREMKLQEIEVQRARIVRLQASETRDEVEERQKQNRLSSMRTRLERLKIFADINDPMIKKRFEDGNGEWSKGRASWSLKSVSRGTLHD